jgi:hypothetical protein
MISVEHPQRKAHRRIGIHVTFKRCPH